VISFIADRSNHALERTAARGTIALQMIKQFQSKPHPLSAAVAQLGLVRPMNLRALLLCVVAFSGCQSEPYPVSNAIRFAFPNIAFHGAYASQLTVDDVGQIVALSRGRADIRPGVDMIEADSPDEATVHSGHPDKTGDLATDFKVRKRNGRWFLLEKTISTGQTVITA
jgi:hypothetical protein